MSFARGDVFCGVAVLFNDWEELFFNPKEKQRGLLGHYSINDLPKMDSVLWRCPFALKQDA